MNQFSRLSMLCVLTAISMASHAVGNYSARSNSATPMPAEGGVETTVLQLSIPAGTWVVSSKVSFVNWLNKDYDRCHLLAGAASIDGATTMTGETDGMPAVATLSNLGIVTTTVKSTFKLNCWHDFGVPNQYIDPDASLVVTRAPK